MFFRLIFFFNYRSVLTTLHNANFEADSVIEFCFDIANQHLDQIIKWANRDAYFDRSDVKNIILFIFKIKLNIYFFLA